MITRDRLKIGSVCGTCFVYIYIYIYIYIYRVYVDSHSLGQLALASKRTASTTDGKVKNRALLSIESEKVQLAPKLPMAVHNDSTVQIFVN